MSTGHGLIIAAPHSGSGKTTITLGLLRALRDGTPYGPVRGAKSGPDYIDPAFHKAACGAPCLNLDAWAMSAAQIGVNASGNGMLIIEGAMGLFDGAPPDGKGATADLARILGLPVVLVINASHMAQSVAAVAAGFARHDPDVQVAGVILNNVGSPRHLAMLKTALAAIDMPVLGAVMRDPALALPSRHLGLVQAGEHSDLNAFIDRAAQAVRAGIDLEALCALARPFTASGHGHKTRNIYPQKIAVARDQAFAFLYAHQVELWHHTGADVRFFSPLANDPVPEADWVFLPGGYPELHAERIAAADTFLDSLKNAGQHIPIVGECGGYMVLGQGLTDANGIRHRMAGLLGLETSFETRRLHLGYRRLQARGGIQPGRQMAHEFHYATTISAEGAPLFDAWDAEGNALPAMGLIEGRVQGSFAHIISSG